MFNRYELTIAFACRACHKENTVESIIESDSLDLKEVARDADYMPRVCAFCDKVGKIEFGDRIKVSPL